MLELSKAHLVDIATSTFEQLFPLVLLATSDDPMPEIIKYIEEDDGRERGPEYSIEQLSQDTGIGEEKLHRWVRAIERKGQAIFYGPPGTGKTFIAQHFANDDVRSQPTRGQSTRRRNARGRTNEWEHGQHPDAKSVRDRKPHFPQSSTKE